MRPTVCVEIPILPVRFQNSFASCSVGGQFMLYGLYWQEVFPWPTPEDETPQSTSPVSGDYIAEVLDLEPGQVLPYCFECLEGGRLDFSVSSSLPIQVVVCTYDHYAMWADLDFEETAPTAIEVRDGIRSASISIRIPAKDEYVVVLVNLNDNPAPIMVFARPVDPQTADSC
jgi:hypothetical protein